MCELPSVCSRSDRKARKTHTCCECDGEIPKGETYHFFSGCWDGRWSDYKTCVDCRKLQLDIDATAKPGDSLAPFGELYLAVFEDREAENRGWIRRYMAIRRKRNAPPSSGGWMEKVEAKLPPESGTHHFPNGTCPKCGGKMIGDGVTTYLRCESLNLEPDAEPDSPPACCRNDPEPT